MDHWEMPVGARFWKEFTRDGVKIETRLIHRFGPGADDWIFGAYEWDDGLGTAVYVPNGVPDAKGTPHDIPSVGQCKNCHTKLSERILGFGAVQLSYAAPAGDASIAGLSAANKLTVPWADGFVMPGDDVASAALGYLHANCGNCHNETGVAVTPMHLRMLVGAATVEDTEVWKTAVAKPTNIFQCNGCNRIEPHFAAESAIIQRMSVRDVPAQMPPLGLTEVADDQPGAGVDKVSAWIDSLPACSSAGEACNDTIGCCGGSCVAQTCVDVCATANAACNGNQDCCSGVCGNGTCSCSGDFQPCASDADCCNNVTCDTANGLCL
jgi:hypothetical protein